MITEQQMRTLFVQANPIPDGDTVPLDEMAATAYLATLEQRSSEVTQLDTKQTEPQSPKRSMMPWLIAAGLAAVIGVAVIIASLNGEPAPVVDEPSPTTLDESIGATFSGSWDDGLTTLNVEGADYVILEAGESVDWGKWSVVAETIIFQSGSGTEVCAEGAEGTFDYSFDGVDTLTLTLRSDDCDASRGLSVGSIVLARLGTGSTGDPVWDTTEVFISPESPAAVPGGDYRTTRFAVPFRFTLSDGWTSFLPQSVATIELTTSELPEVDVAFKILEPSTVDETVELFISREELGASQPIPTIVGGASGVTFGLNPTEIVTIFSDENGAYPGEPGLPRLQIHVVDVAGQPVTIIERHPDASGNAFENQGQPLLDSIVWKSIG